MNRSSGPVTEILWFRRDLRLTDNPALRAALAAPGPTILVYIDAPQDEGDWPQGAASRWWLHHSLQALAREIGRLGGELFYLRGNAADCLARLVRQYGARRVHAARRYEPASRAQEAAVAEAIAALGAALKLHAGNYQHAPETIVKDDGTPYRVYTPWWRRWRSAGLSGSVQPPPARIPPPPAPPEQASGLSDLKLLPRIPWDREFPAHHRPGEAGALDRLETFVAKRFAGYARNRDQPAVDGTSGLSAHLHFGEITPRQAVAALLETADPACANDPLEAAEPWLKELAWREFSCQVLFHFPDLPEQPIDRRFEAFPWQEATPELLDTWQQGRTGIPLVDAGMRQLWRSGTLHNRVRMVVASFLTKNLLLPWQLGQHWFWDTLVDADLACNAQNWQWVAGCGLDAAPYYRIFNPLRQAQRFDPDGEYIRRWVPELKDGGSNYPEPMVDLAASRKRALAQYQTIRTAPVA